MEDRPYGCQDPKPVIKESDTLYLCVYFYDLSESVYDEISVQLERDGMIIPYKFYSNKEIYPGVGINLTVKTLRETFNGIYDYGCTMASSYSGFYWQECLKTYQIPDSYKNRIKRISVIDPQLGGCD